MDRFPRRVVVGWGLLAAGVVLCAVWGHETQRPRTAPALDRPCTTVASSTYSKARRANPPRPEAASTRADNRVIPVGHLFAPPPIPSAREHLLNVPHDAAQPSGRGPTVRMAPGIVGPDATAPAMRRIPAVQDELDDVLRKLPPIEPIEPGILPPHTKLMRIDGNVNDSNDDDTMYLLPPVSDDGSMSEADRDGRSGSDRQQTPEPNPRRLPAPTLDDLPGVMNSPNSPTDVPLRRLPRVEQDTELPIADEASPEAALEALPGATSEALLQALPESAPGDQPDDLESLPPLESALNTVEPTEPLPTGDPEPIPPDPLAGDAVLLEPDWSDDGPWMVVTPPPAMDALVPPAPSVHETDQPVQGTGVPRRLPALESMVREEHPSYTYSIQDSAALSALDRHVDAMARRAAELTTRGAYFAARAEVLKALRAITQTLDAQAGTREHSDALARAMRAFQEACDFAPRGSRLEAELDLTLIVNGHRTPVLKCEDLARMTSVVAQQHYLHYAQTQFTMACGGLPVASQALYTLARVYTLMDRAKVETQTLCVPQAVALHQAALVVDPRNSQAANELGVLLANCGQLEEARQVLLHSVSIRPEATAWHNLSVVHQRLGQTELARRASEQAITTADANSEQPAGVPVQSVHWVDPHVFSTAPALPDP